MANLGQEVTHSIIYLRKLSLNLDKLKEKTLTCFKDIKNYNKDDENNSSIKKILNDYKDDMNDNFDFINPEFDLFMSDMTSINKYKHDDIVIYSLNEYSNFLFKYKKIKKHLNRDMIDPINDAYKHARYDDDFVKEIAYGDLLSYCKKIMRLADRTVEKLKITLGDKSIDDE
jgi:hypothetical protein